jgi:hypothetical protein
MPQAPPGGATGIGIHETLTVELSMQGAVTGVFDPVQSIAPYRRVIAALTQTALLQVAVLDVNLGVTVGLTLPGVTLDQWSDTPAWDPTQAAAFGAAVAAYMAMPSTAVSVSGLGIETIYPSPPPPTQSPPPAAPALPGAPPGPSGHRRSRSLLAVVTSVASMTVTVVADDVGEAASHVTRWNSGLNNGAVFLQISRYGVGCSDVRINQAPIVRDVRVLTTITIDTAPGAVPGAAASTAAFQLNTTLRSGAFAAAMRAAGLPVTAASATSGFGVQLIRYDNSLLVPPPPAPPLPPAPAADVSPLIVPCVVGGIGGVGLIALCVGAVRWSKKRQAAARDAEKVLQRGLIIQPERAPRGPAVGSKSPDRVEDDAGRRRRRRQERIPAFGDAPTASVSFSRAYGAAPPRGERSPPGRGDSAFDLEAGREVTSRRRDRDRDGRPRRERSERGERSGERRASRRDGRGRRDRMLPEDAEAAELDGAPPPARVAPRAPPRRLGSHADDMRAWAEAAGLV